MTKRFFSIAAVALLVLVLTACGKHQPNTPEGVATAAMNCIIDKDYEGYVDLMYFKDGKELSKERRQQLIVLVEDKVGDKAAEKGGIKGNHKVFHHLLTAIGREQNQSRNGSQNSEKREYCSDICIG